ncbi:MAG TPA: NBR1-Ig-like domain-containing protein [Anaerolineales bacterium]
MSRLSKFTWLWMVFIFLGLASCGGGAPTTDPSLAFTQIWQTVAVAQAQTALAASQTPSLTVTPAVSSTPQTTNTPLMTNTPLPGIPSMTPIVSSAPVVTQSGLCDNAVGVTDVTYPDGAIVPAGESFIKTWKVKNLGPCTWTQNYRLIYGWPAGGAGTNWNTTRPSVFTASVLPGETIDISVTLKAPTTAGNYAAAFRMQNDKGFNFGPAQTVVIVVK